MGGPGLIVFGDTSHNLHALRDPLGINLKEYQQKYYLYTKLDTTSDHLYTSKGSYRSWEKIVKVWVMMMMKEEMFASHPSLALPPPPPCLDCPCLTCPCPQPTRHPPPPLTLAPLTLAPLTLAS